MRASAIFPFNSLLWLFNKLLLTDALLNTFGRGGDFNNWLDLRGFWDCGSLINRWNLFRLDLGIISDCWDSLFPLEA